MLVPDDLPIDDIGQAAFEGTSGLTGCLAFSDLPLIDGRVELFLPVEQVAVWWFSDWCDHAEADVAFVADPVPRVNGIQRA
jgi:hypothetical protein